MFVFEIEIPGTWLDYVDRDWSWDVEGQLRHLQSQFFEANTALNLFTQAQSVHPSFTNSEDWEHDSQRRYEIEQALRLQRGGTVSPDQWERIRFEAEVIFKREKWSNGRTPIELERNIPFIYARAFLYALDAFDKFLGILSKKAGVSPALKIIHEQMTVDFPHLRGVRNSAQHLEDRARHLGPGGKPLDLKPIENNIVSAPGGGVLILNCLNGSNYGSTMADGHYGEVDVSTDSMVKLHKIIISVFNEFKWKGPRQHAPSA